LSRGLGVSGIVVGGGTQGCKIYNNVVGDMSVWGIQLMPGADGNLLLDNVVHRCLADGIFIDSGGNHVDNNTTTLNGGFGLLLGPGSFGNHVGDQSAFGNGGGPCPPAGGWSPDFCDSPNFLFPPLTGPNFSYGNNLMPGAAGPI
jgi:parallel beta-helix repeat protein